MKTKNGWETLCDYSYETNSDSMYSILNEFFALVFTDEMTDKIPEVKDMFKDQEGNRLSDVCITVKIVHR